MSALCVHRSVNPIFGPLLFLGALRRSRRRWHSRHLWCRPSPLGVDLRGKQSVQVGRAAARPIRPPFRQPRRRTGERLCVTPTVWPHRCQRHGRRCGEAAVCRLLTDPTPQRDHRQRRFVRRDWRLGQVPEQHHVRAGVLHLLHDCTCAVRRQREILAGESRNGGAAGHPGVPALSDLEPFPILRPIRRWVREGRQVDRRLPQESVSSVGGVLSAEAIADRAKILHAS